jgi:hypothetical protein
MLGRFLLKAPSFIHIHAVFSAAHRLMAIFAYQKRYVFLALCISSIS